MNVYFPNLNGLRFLAALSVMVFHFPEGHKIINGHYGVVLFFVLSGFLITYLLLTEQQTSSGVSIKAFYLRRILRIWPLYYLIIVVASIVIFAFPDTLKVTLNSYYSSIPYYLFFIPNVAFAIGMALPFIGVLWSVGSEEHFYLIWPWLFLIKNRKWLATIFLIIIVSFSATPHLIDFLNNRFANGEQNSWQYISVFIKFLPFNAMATGALFALAVKYNWAGLKYFYSKTFQVVVIIVTLYSWLTDVHYRYFNEQIFVVLFAIIILNLAVNKNSIISLENRVFNFLGRISYGLYVYHLVVLFLVNKVLPADINPFLGFTSYLLATIFVSAISYQYFEKPFLRIKSRKYTVVQSGG